MKNVYLIPTDKTIKTIGDLVKDQFGDIHIFTKNDGKEYGKTTTKLNIYITSDEEIKEGDWFLQTTYEGIFKCSDAKIEFIYFDTDSYEPKQYCEKIILTTDQDLIKDGVQAIDYEFLEWFVKNPSCEDVEVNEFYGFAEDYLIVIPNEEPNI